MTMIGQRKAGAFVASEFGRSGGERRQSDRRQVTIPVDAERRTTGERRVTAERRLWVGSAAAASPAPPIVGVEAAPSHVDAIAHHRRMLTKRVGRDVGQEVATLDYFLNVRPGIARPTVIESAELSALERRAMTDSLTGLFNRGFLESVLVRELARCRRHGVMLSLLMVDLDDFKATNDRFGHGTGDAALRSVAEVMPAQLRAADIPCRYGGDEFAIVLPDTYRSGAVLVAERIVAEVRHLASARPFAGLRIGLTVSVGVASYGADCATYRALLDAADRALYEAKAGGGDRTAPQQ